MVFTESRTDNAEVSAGGKNTPATILTNCAMISGSHVTVNCANIPTATFEIFL